MKHRKLISIMVSASMAFNVIGASARTLFADTEVPEEVQTEETELTTESSEADVTIEESVQTEEETSPAEPSEQIPEEGQEQIIDGDEETIESEESSETEGSEGEEPTGETDETTESSETSETDETTESSETSETSESTETSETEETEEEEEELVAFSAEAVIDGVLVSVTADEGVFPAGSYMEAYRVYDAGADALVDGSRGSDINVVRSLTFDITIYDEDGNEIEPDTEMGSVYVSFSDVLVADVNLDVDVYHITDNTAYEMSADVYDDTVVVETNSFSYYTVEFTYGNMEYVLPGDSTVALSDILTYVGLQGEVSAASVSNPSLFNAYQENGVWYVSANAAFDTEEWMVVTIDGIDYSITVTDAATVQMHVGSLGFDPQGNPYLQTTFGNKGYATYLQVNGYSERVQLPSTAEDMNLFGRVFSQGPINATLSYNINPAGNAIIVTYTMTNTNTEDAVSLRIGSAADTQVKNADSCAVSFTPTGIRMFDPSSNNEFYLYPGNGAFTTRWTGNYSGGSYLSHVFDDGDSYNSGDSALAYSWTVIVPAGATVTRTAVFTAGNSLPTHNVNFYANGGVGTMDSAPFAEDVPGSLPACEFTRPDYSFIGWVTSEDRIEEATRTKIVDYADQGQISISTDVNLYAIWLPSAVIEVIPPVAAGLVYNGQPQAVFSAPGSCTGGTMQYSLDGVSWMDTIPTRTNAGTYTVWYRGHGDADHGDSEPQPLQVIIAKANPQVTPPAAITGLEYTGSAQTLITRGSTDFGTLEYSLSETGGYSTTLPAGTNAGTYTVYYRVPGSSNYNAYGPNSLTVDISKVNSTLDTAPTPRTPLAFNASEQELATAGAATGGTIVYALSETGPWSASIPTKRDAGTYTVYYKVQGDQNHFDAPGGQFDVTITRIDASIYADDGTKVYGQSDPELTTTRPGEIAGEPLVYTITREAGEDAGTYLITVSADPDDNPNYNVSIDARASRGIFHITQAPATITANNIQKEYGETDPLLTATVEGVVNGDSLNYTLSRTAGESVGTYTISVHPGVNRNYTVTVETGTFTIGRASATISADDITKVYGDADPELTVSYDGLVNGDTALDYTIARVQGENVGDYEITVTAGSNPNYNVSVVRGTFSITPADATITAVDNTKVYGSADPSFDVTYTGLVNGDTDLDYNIECVHAEDVGDYEITVTVTAGSNPNYNVSVVNGTFSITPADATITAVDNTKVYGSADPSFEVTYTGLVNGDTDLDYNIECVHAEDVGDYEITVTVTAGSNPNYNVSVVNGTFSITPADATITVVDNTKVYGSADPSFEVTYTGLVNGDTELEHTFERASGEDVGEYTVNAVNGNNPNYNVSVVPGTLAITPAAATITADNQTKVYGEADPEFTVTYTGLVNGDTALDYNIVCAHEENAGEYDIVVTAGTNPNYTVTVVNGLLTIKKADPVVTAPVGFSLIYSGDPQALFEEGSTTGGTMQYSLDGENYAAGMRSATDVGTYTIRYRVVGDNNYNDVEGGFVNTTITAPSGGNPTVPIYVDGQPVMVNPNEPIPHPTTPSRYGYDFGGWFADEACTIPIDFNSIVGNQGIRMYSKWTSIYYTLTEGADGTWFDGEGQLVFRAVRNRAEETTFSHYMNVYVDGNLLGANDFTAESGSVIIRLNPAYLATLAIGEHTLDIEFDDAEGVRTKFYILADASSTSIGVPGAAGTTGSADAVGSTGEEFSIRSAMIITMLFAASGICALVSLKYRKETEE